MASNNQWHRIGNGVMKKAKIMKAKWREIIIEEMAKKAKHGESSENVKPAKWLMA